MPAFLHSHHWRGKCSQAPRSRPERYWPLLNKPGHIQHLKTPAAGSITFASAVSMTILCYYAAVCPHQRGTEADRQDDWRFRYPHCCNRHSASPDPPHPQHQRLSAYPFLEALPIRLTLLHSPFVLLALLSPSYYSNVQHDVGHF